MTDWNYFLVNIYLSFNFLINTTCTRKEDDGATVLLVLISQMPVAKYPRSVLWKQGLKSSSMPSTAEQTLVGLWFFGS